MTEQDLFVFVEKIWQGEYRRKYRCRACGFVVITHWTAKKPVDCPNCEADIEPLPIDFETYVNFFKDEKFTTVWRDDIALVYRKNNFADYIAYYYIDLQEMKEYVFDKAFELQSEFEWDRNRTDRDDEELLKCLDLGYSIEHVHYLACEAPLKNIALAAKIIQDRKENKR